MLKKKIANTIGLFKKTDCNAKITEIEGKIPSISGLAITTALTAVENKIPDVSNLVKKTDYNTKIDEIKKKITDHNYDKYITIAELNKLTTENFVTRLAQANLASKSDIANSVNKTDFNEELKNLNKKVTSNKTKHVLVENELIEKIDSSFYIG